jgi:hypothetical protein
MALHVRQIASCASESCESTPPELSVRVASLWTPPDPSTSNIDEDRHDFTIATKRNVTLTVLHVLLHASVASRHLHKPIRSLRP